MRINNISLHPYQIPLKSPSVRSGIFLQIHVENGKSAWGEVAPLPKWSKETLDDSSVQLKQKIQEILEKEWIASTCLKEIESLKLLPSVSFGLESAILSILCPLYEYQVPTSALLMGSVSEILNQAMVKISDGYTSAKLKVSHLSFAEAYEVIHQLKHHFRLRIDVNRAWTTSESLQFFSQFSLDSFDYVEEPFQNPNDLAKFLHPLAVDESFPNNLSLEQLESLPTLKALIYKPTIQGGMVGCLPLHAWAANRGINLVLSSSFESDLGLAYVASIAHRLSLTAPVGIGTYDHLQEMACGVPLRFSHSFVSIPALLFPKTEHLHGVHDCRGH